MKKNSLLLLLMLSSILSYSSVINGNVFLDNTSDSSGITIKFNPISPSSVYTETISNSNGIFSINVTDGIYNINFEKNGYQTYILENQFINTDISLENIILNSNEIINISGNVSGNWTSNNTYIINGNTTIPLGQTLNIEPGTEIKFSGYYSINVNGNINAIGNENSYIKFTSNNSNPTNKDWNQIKINSTSSESKMKFCIIEYAKESNNANDGMINIIGKLNIENCIIRNSDQTGIYVRNNSTDLDILNNTILNCKYGIYVGTDKAININGNNISNISVSGITVGPNSNSINITNNEISNCEGYGTQTWADILINNNLLYQIGSSSNVYSIMVVGGQPEIRNNTIFNNSGGIGIYSSDFFTPNPIIDSNIIYNNTYYGIKSEGSPMPHSVKYNLFKDNGSGVGNNLPVGVGTIITTNHNGTDSDTYYNIFSLPDFKSTDSSDLNFCELNLTSNAINAGNPSITNDFNSTITDIGAKESSNSKSLSINQFEKNNGFIIFPNPVIDNVSIKTQNEQSFNKIVLLNLNGQIIREYKFEKLINEFSLENLEKLAPAIYVLTIYTKTGKVKIIKLLKK